MAFFCFWGRYFWERKGGDPNEEPSEAEPSISKTKGQPKKQTVPKQRPAERTITPRLYRAYRDVPDKDWRYSQAVISLLASQCDDYGFHAGMQRFTFTKTAWQNFKMNVSDLAQAVEEYEPELDKLFK